MGQKAVVVAMELSVAVTEREVVLVEVTVSVFMPEKVVCAQAMVVDWTTAEQKAE